MPQGPETTAGYPDGKRGVTPPRTRRCNQAEQSKTPLVHTGKAVLSLTCDCSRQKLASQKTCRETLTINLPGYGSMEMRVRIRKPAPVHGRGLFCVCCIAPGGQQEEQTDEDFFCRPMPCADHNNTARRTGQTGSGYRHSNPDSHSSQSDRKFRYGHNF